MSDRVWGPREGKTGPVHLVADPYSSQAWCGARAQFRHRQRPGTRAEVTCKTCLRRIKVGRPQSRRR